jgi:hypothetical protein
MMHGRTKTTGFAIAQPILQATGSTFFDCIKFLFQLRAFGELSGREVTMWKLLLCGSVLFCSLSGFVEVRAEPAVETAWPVPSCRQYNPYGQCMVCFWKILTISGKADTEKVIMCPNMAPSRDVRIKARVQFYQENWGPPDAEREHRNRHQLMRGNLIKWSGGFHLTRKCSISSFDNQFNKSLGPSRMGENVRTTWKITQCTGCTGDYTCGAQLSDVTISVRQ